MNILRKPKWLTFTRFLLIAFVITRLFIWVARPENFSEIIYSYMPYAHLWAGGTIPYRQQWYEYPPATIPLFYLPHVVDMATHPFAFHSNYSDNYRFLLLLTDCLVFWLVWKTLRKQGVSEPIFIGGILYYILLTAKAHHLIYDTMDYTFALGLTVTVTAPILLSNMLSGPRDLRLLFQPKLASFYSWLGFWLSTALKYVNAPLAPLYALLERKSPIKLLISAIIAFLLIWGVPAILYRSSIVVSLVYHQNRGIQIDSVPSIILRQISHFTKTEHVIEVYKNYEIAGPMTETIKPFVTILFAGSIGLFLLVMSYLILRKTKIPADWWRIHLTLGYILLFYLTGKVLSPPFLLWQIPLLALYPFKNQRQQLLMLVPSFIALFVTMTPASNAELGIMTLPILVGWIRTIGLVWLFGYWVWLTVEEVKD
jgi:hypothetical protein